MATKLKDTKDGDRQVVDSVVIRFAGDSGDGMQLTGNQFTQSTALMGNDLSTFPDFPAEIRAPVGTTYGVSAFQINFASHDIKTPGDSPDVLVAMNPAALKVHLRDLSPGGTIIINTGAFTERNIQKAGYKANPLEDGTVDSYRLIQIDISKLTLAAVEGTGVNQKEGLRAKNLWTLGLMCWMYDRDRQPTIDWLNQRFGKQPEIAAANIAALNAGHAYGETAELSSEITTYIVPKAKVEPGIYRAVTGVETTTWGLLVGAQKAGLNIFLGSYPITPASPLLHALSNLRQYGVVTFQAEDEISAICSAIGASFAGSLGLTSSSGPGIALKSEALGLAVVAELPLVVVNFQRAGPSTGLPTKTEQSDLNQAVFGRNADTPLPVISASTPSDCFECAIEVVRIATKYMTPVIFLNEGYLANAAEPWKLPDADAVAEFPVEFHTETDGFHPYLRDETTNARPWAKPGTEGLMHRIGGIEKDYDSGNISYDPENHHKMTKVRAQKILGIADDIPPQAVASGNEKGKLAVVGWGSTFGAIEQAVKKCQDDNLDVSHIHIRHIWPLPKNLGDLLKGFDKILVPEMNNGQLVKLLRAEYLVPAEPLTQITGQPFKVADLEREIRDRL
ncbi:MAG: 2-oxoacid:acceptor oxidoreductase subunit alpha [Rhodospirillaceae bacterium]|jgi:2-oxoglutarate/2-oxoacid ferredoxin oxidoreductase subunit alpha|nr:2-oxoacid:acceptor oxidoreductase subunit alpha [Rhodospirillaceae bacterium]MBT5456530.1 2-oxoacid:acceptor oxidoreductase subunit alpha [Rhodospirillaceae bacterium]